MNEEDDDDILGDDELEENVDAQPMEHETPVSPIVEAGLSVAPEDLGKQWLGTATEQGNFESSSIEAEEEVGIHIRRLVTKE
jgi:hypothetical protein